jgi:1-acyl-sn-glycerol-3-phosphate acyltransferase
MLARIEIAWRWLVTAFSYLMFGLGGLMFSIVAVPVLFCLPGGKPARTRRTQQSLHFLLRAYVRMMRLLGVVTYQIEGIEKLQGSRLILANHPSLLDVVFLIAMVPNACCVVKGKLTRNFFTRGPIRTAGYIINEAAADVIDAAARAMAAGQTLIIFPEGTRTDPARASLHFRRGAANVAIRTVSAITPVLIYCQPAGLTKNQRWYQVPAKRMHLRFLVMDQYSIDHYLNDPPSRGARNLSADLMDYFSSELKAHG